SGDGVACACARPRRGASEKRVRLWEGSPLAPRSIRQITLARLRDLPPLLRQLPLVPSWSDGQQPFGGAAIDSDAKVALPAQLVRLPELEVVLQRQLVGEQQPGALRADRRWRRTA